MDNWLRWWRGEEDLVYVDVEDYQRQKAIREAEYRAACDAASRVLRVSTRPKLPVRRVTGITEIVRTALR